MINLKKPEIRMRYQHLLKKDQAHLIPYREWVELLDLSQKRNRLLLAATKAKVLYWCEQAGRREDARRCWNEITDILMALEKDGLNVTVFDKFEIVHFARAGYDPEWITDVYFR